VGGTPGYKQFGNFPLVASISVNIIALRQRAMVYVNKSETGKE
jgi:hypothetical protein